MEKITSYIKKNLKKGYTKESLRWALIEQRYSRFIIEKAIRKADIDLANKAPVLETKPEIKYEVIEPKEYARIINNSIKPKSFWSNIFGF